MGDAVLFTVVFAGLFVLRAVLATVFFYFIMPEGDHCPNCDAVTVRMQSRGWKFFAPRMRPSWCFECGWDGLLRPGALTPLETRELSKTADR